MLLRRFDPFGAAEVGASDGRSVKVFPTVDFASDTNGDPLRGLSPFG
jgi:hypothetical protein